MTKVLSAYFFKIISICLGFFIAADFAVAAGHQYHFGGGVYYFAGLPQASFASNTGNVLRLGGRFGERGMFSWVSDASFMTSSGSMDIKVNGVAATNNYQLTGGEFAMGFRFVPLANSSHLPIQPFIAVQGVVQLNSVKFPDASSSVTTFPKTDTQYFTGYMLTAGADVYFGKRWGVSLQVDQVSADGTLASQTYTSGGNRFLFLLFAE